MKPRNWLYLLTILAGLGACSGAHQDDLRPDAALAGSLGAQREFRAIHEAWIAAAPDKRVALEPRIRRFLAGHPADDRARVVRVYLAWIRIQQGRLDEARKVVAATQRGPAGSTRDFAVVTEAAILSRQGKPDQALALLAPLDGKIVDPDERLVYGEELVHAAIGARRWRSAIGYMLDWLAQAAPEDREAVERQIERLLDGVPTRALEGSLVDLDQEAQKGEGSSSRTPAQRWLRKSLRARLARLALERGDAALAKRLIDSGPAALRASEQGDQLARLAARGQVVPRVAGRAVGLLLSVATTDSRRRSAAVAAGMSRALGLPKAAGRADAVRLVARDDGGDVAGTEHALAELAGDGAAILVAGVDADGAARAARYAASQSIPVILLARTPDDAGDGYGFNIGADDARATQTLLDALQAAGAKHVARVGPGGASCSTAPLAAGMPRFPVQQWKHERVDALALLGDAGCSRDAIAELAAAGRRPLVGLGLESGDLLPGLGKQAGIALATGHFPYVQDADAPADMRGFVERAGEPPDWYAALGHDAALLASSVLSSFPLERVDDARAVARLHEKARQRLAVTDAALWTSDRKGFEGGRNLARQLATVRTR